MNLLRMSAGQRLLLAFLLLALLWGGLFAAIA